MLLLADSGSSKTAWALLDIKQKKVVVKCETIGLNPLHHGENEILATIKQESQLTKYADKITHLEYFGAGCSSSERCEQMKNVLQRHFVGAKIVVKSDLWAAVIATCGKQKGVVCILGTGSNACYFDGKKITQHTPALGYILGDEGSGSHLGKQLLTKYFYKQMPPDLRLLFEKKYKLHKENVFDAIYRGDNPKKYLAGFTHFIGENKKHIYIKSLIINSFTYFLEFHIKHYLHKDTSLSIHFVGSIAHHFRNILVETVKSKEWQVGKVLKQPLDGLIDHYFECFS